MNIILDKGAYMPKKAHESDAGYDIRTPVDIMLHAKDYAVIKTGVHIEIPTGYVGLIKSKSGLNVKHNIVSEGVIDAGYTGEIVVKLYNHGFFDYCFSKGDKITQLVIIPILSDVTLNKVDSFEKTERNDNGFGSSGK